MWDKTNRPASGDERQAFTKEATGYVLPKTNKLSVPNIKQDEDGALKHVYNLQSQLNSLKAVIHNCDMLDVFTIVVPVNVAKGPELRAGTFDLFTDFPRLHPDIVATSCGWYNRWVQDSYIAENMNLTRQLFENNTDPTLWSKCMEEYDEYPPMQQGGPLALSLILRRIQDVSEDAIEHLKDKIKFLKIKDIPGENVDYAVSLIKSTYRALQSASTGDRTFVPDDFPCTVLKVFQTTSVSEFNAAFAEEDRQVRRQADKFGGIPRWPTITTITNLATSMYARLKNKGDWIADKKTATKAYQSSTGSPNSRPSGPSSSQSNRECWNCGSKDHLLPDCPKPRDQPRIDAARKQFRAQNPNRSGRPPRRKTIDGKPMIRNRKGVYVLDQKKVRDTQKKKILQGLISALESQSKTRAPTDTPADDSQTAATPDSGASTAAARSSTDKTEVSFKAEAIRSVLLDLVQPLK